MSTLIELYFLCHVARHEVCKRRTYQLGYGSFVKLFRVKFPFNPTPSVFLPFFKCVWIFIYTTYPEEDFNLAGYQRQVVIKPTNYCYLRKIYGKLIKLLLKYSDCLGGDTLNKCPLNQSE